MAGKVLSRAEAQVMRLACVYAVLDGSLLVRLEHLKAAGALWDYCESSVRLVFGDALGDSNVEKLLAALKAASPNGMTKSEINVKVFGRHKKAAEMATILSDLLTAGLSCRRVGVGTGGRTPELDFYGKDTGHPGNSKMRLQAGPCEISGQTIRLISHAAQEVRFRFDASKIGVQLTSLCFLRFFRRGRRNEYLTENPGRTGKMG